MKLEWSIVLTLRWRGYIGPPSRKGGRAGPPSSQKLYDIRPGTHSRYPGTPAHNVRQDAD